MYILANDVCEQILLISIINIVLFAPEEVLYKRRSYYYLLIQHVSSYHTCPAQQVCLPPGHGLGTSW